MIRQHKSSIIGIYTFLLLFSLIIWLDGYHNILLLCYGFLLGTFIIGVLIGISYYRQKNLNHLLKNKINFNEYHLLNNDHDKISKLFFNVLDKQYNYFYEKLKEVQLEREEQQLFVYKWVHQMKTPLSVLELMIADNYFEQDSYLEETDKLHKGLSLALNMSRLESFQQDFVIEKVNIKHMMLDLINNQKQFFIIKNIFPTITIDDDIVINTDKKWLYFIVEQIIINSVKYTPYEETRLNIIVENNEDDIVIIIKDFGIGIDSQDIGRVFDPFFTGQNGRIFQESTGMGLYLVNKIVQAMSYEIKIDSSINEGTEVRISNF